MKRLWLSVLIAIWMFSGGAPTQSQEDGTVPAPAKAKKKEKAKTEAAPKKAGVTLTAAEQQVADRIKKEDPAAVLRILHNKFCPLTGKLVDPSIPPIDIKQKYHHEFILVGVADAQAFDKFAAQLGKGGAETLKKSLAGAARNNMLLRIAGEGQDAAVEMVRLDLPPEMCAPIPAPKDVPVAITVDASKKYQTIDGLGTATYAYNKAIQAEYAKPEFQKLIAEDLGLSMIRFPMVPCLFDPVEKPEDISRKNFKFEGELDPIPINTRGKPGAKTSQGALGCLKFVSNIIKINPEIRAIGTVWSPPHWMKTNNGQTGGGSLKPEYYRHFARYLIEWVRFVKEQYGVDVYAISPQNELVFREVYDSCVYTPEEYANMLAILGEELDKEKMDVKVFGPEDMTKVVGRAMKFVTAVQANPIAAKTLDIIATHGYSDGIESTGSVSENSEFWNRIKDLGKPYWMTETGAGAPDDRWRDGGPDGKSVEMSKQGVPSDKLEQGALSSVGGRLHYALVYGNASGWVFWQITGEKPSEHSVMVGDKPGAKYYVYKHFCRWIRPGAVRIEAGPDGGDKGVCVSAYEHPKNGTVTIVLLNRSDDNANVSITLKTTAPVASFETYRSTETEPCATQPATVVKDGKASLTLPPRSIVTLYGKTL